MVIVFKAHEWSSFKQQANAILPDGLTMEINFDSHSIDEDYYIKNRQIWPYPRENQDTAIYLISNIGIIGSRTIDETKWEERRLLYLIGLLEEMIEDYRRYKIK